MAVMLSFVGNPTGTNAVYLCDLATSNITLVSYSTINSGVANAPSDMPAISGDGRYVAYRSYATDIVAGDTNPAPKIYLFDRLTGQNAILSPAQNSATPSPWVYGPVISGGGENVAFLSAGSDLVAGDLNRFPDAFAVRVLIPHPDDACDRARRNHDAGLADGAVADLRGAVQKQSDRPALAGFGRGHFVPRQRRHGHRAGGSAVPVLSRF